MKRREKSQKIIFALLLIGIIFVFNINIILAEEEAATEEVQYAEQPNYLLQVPIFDFTKAECIADYIEAIFKYGVALLVPIAIIIIIYAGVKWIVAAGNAAKIKEAQKYISGAIIGLVIALMSYFVLDLLNLTTLVCPAVGVLEKGLYTPTFDPLPPLHDPITPPTDVNCTGEGSGEKCNCKEGTQILADNGIKTNHPGGECCCNASNCTCLQGMKENTIERIIQLKEATGCPIRVSGGTETGHSCKPGYCCHQEGNCVDFTDNDCLAPYLSDPNFRANLGITSICTTQNRASDRYNCGNFWEDSPHYHIQFK